MRGARSLAPRFLTLISLMGAGVVYSGMGPDFRVLVKAGQKKAQAYFLTYRVGRIDGWHMHSRPPTPRPPPHRALLKEDIPVLELVREIATVMQEFTQSGGVRPFGVSLLVAGWVSSGEGRWRTSQPYALLAASSPAGLTTTARRCTRWTRRARTLAGVHRPLARTPATPRPSSSG